MDHRFNELDQSQNFSSLKEPRFCMFIPLAKGVCCGFISLKTTLLTIVAIDIALSIAWVAIGVQRYLRSKLNSIYAIESSVNAVSLVLAVICLVAIIKKKANLLRYYFVWKCIEIIVMPFISIAAIAMADRHDISGKTSIAG